MHKAIDLTFKSIPTDIKKIKASCFFQEIID